MTYERFLKHIKNEDFIMIKLTDEYPFFVDYEQIEKMLSVIENCVVDGAKRIEERIGGKDAIIYI